MTKILVDKRADIHSPDNSKSTPVHYAACNRDVEVLKLMIEKGADVNAKNKNN